MRHRWLKKLVLRFAEDVVIGPMVKATPATLVVFNIIKVVSLCLASSVYKQPNLIINSVKWTSESLSWLLLNQTDLSTKNRLLDFSKSFTNQPRNNSVIFKLKFTSSNTATIAYTRSSTSTRVQWDFILNGTIPMSSKSSTITTWRTCDFLKRGMQYYQFLLAMQEQKAEDYLLQETLKRVSS